MRMWCKFLPGRRKATVSVNVYQRAPLVSNYFLGYFLSSKNYSKLFKAFFVLMSVKPVHLAIDPEMQGGAAPLGPCGTLLYAQSKAFRSMADSLRQLQDITRHDKYIQVYTIQSDIVNICQHSNIVIQGPSPRRRQCDSIRA